MSPRFSDHHDCLHIGLPIKTEWNNNSNRNEKLYKTYNASYRLWSLAPKINETTFSFKKGYCLQVHGETEVFKVSRRQWASIRLRYFVVVFGHFTLLSQSIKMSIKLCPFKWNAEFNRFDSFVLMDRLLWATIWIIRNAATQHVTCKIYKMSIKCKWLEVVINFF